MDKEKRKHFTIMIIPHSEKKSVVLNVPVYIFKIISIMLVMTSILSIMFIKQYYDYREEAKYAQRSKQENKNLTREFASVAKDAIALRDKVAEIEELDILIRKQNDFDPTKSYYSAENRKALAQGGPEDKTKVTASSVVASEAQEAIQLIKESVPELQESLEELHTLMEKRNSEESAKPSIRPTSGNINSGFGYRKDPFTFRPDFHTGIDIANRTGTPIYATADGKVIHAKYDGGYGRSILIYHGDGISTRYAHLSRYAVDANAEVKKGTLIGYMGSSGRSTGPHLHYEVIINGKPTDPTKFLP
ncbi:hypothetical protein BHU72_12855 [Desulfuribacillus stibiiarsenatis]|uniref:M23ase beta-sheet core domain-containing protein n=1 Tax=Desulfuribacillus stibiiarsenatis TaxID=1390249 RepID=A0A1E5L8W1_9FIRM|nr:M23 family metallopeptidase [Desulfuribacillus stibiiarsenatis]OEH86498.1 hypothetical protein BHU72_12855 [Desulfuribacillus stibiiarsenatis]